MRRAGESPEDNVNPFTGNPAVVDSNRVLRPVALRLHLSMDLPLTAGAVIARWRLESKASWKDDKPLVLVFASCDSYCGWSDAFAAANMIVSASCVLMPTRTRASLPSCPTRAEAESCDDDLRIVVLLRDPCVMDLRAAVGAPHAFQFGSTMQGREQSVTRVGAVARCAT